VNANRRSEADMRNFVFGDQLVTPALLRCPTERNFASVPRAHLQHLTKSGRGFNNLL